MKVYWRHKVSGKEGQSDKAAYEKWAAQHPSDAARYEIVQEVDDNRPMIVDQPLSNPEQGEEE